MSRMVTVSSVRRPEKQSRLLNTMTSPGRAV